ncbi:sensor histidine kinase [Sediminitomix flava]|uniref:histidine kinase n=1 Tax=Sediminitomix flava TaxID=379075 RepID=A0A315ZUJ9_SEDFL|nr:ATP-binding protein [Sediminitomix flava]PWJ39319.1 two-component system phosphate regulon sensor histidine kinase PhoR [Sediminitomix flava]
MTGGFRTFVFSKLDRNMWFSSKAVSFLLASCVSLITVAFLSLLNGVDWVVYVVAGTISFSSAFILTYVTLEFMIFRELNKVNNQIEILKSESVSPEERIKIFQQGSSKIFQKMNADIADYAHKKEEEIDRLRKMEIYRREFLADVSHELKTPIFAAQGYILTLLDGAIDDENVRMKFLKRAAKSLNGLDALVRDLLTISHMESGEISMDMEIFDLQTLATDVVDQLEGKAHKKGLEIYYEVENDDEIAIEGDYNRIRQVLVNLVTNSIKYNKEDEGWVKVILEDKGEEVNVVIEDNGIGISEEDLQRIFERFYRVDKSRSKKAGGTGLGLAIVKHIIEAHDSRIHVSSELGKGTRCEFALKKYQDLDEEV